ncbi:MAG: zinc ABC transporter substrate-binding protein [Clostridia bacterium]|nr:zinc ABC transporter substrate-binding protein [Clostridia bacterium]
MKRLKTKIFALLCAVFLCMGSGCTVLGTEPVYAGADLHIVTTVFPPYDFARSLTAGNADVCVQQLLQPGTESHTFDPTPADILAVQNCDIFIYTGGESDAWVDTLLSAVDNDSMHILRMMDCTEVVAEETVEGMTHRHDHDHNETCEEDHDHDHAETEDDDHAHEVEYDEHVWTDPDNAALITETILDVLCEADPDNASLYRANGDGYLEQLAALDAYFEEITAGASRDTVVFGDRFPFRYLCDAYGLSYRAAFPGCAAESEPSAATMIYLIEKIRAEDIPVIFTIEMSNGKIASAIAEETGAEILTMHSCHNRIADEAAADVTYLDLMYANAEALKRALQ